MKKLIIAASAAVLVACGGGDSAGDVSIDRIDSLSPIQMVDQVVMTMREATETINAVNTAEDAEAAVPTLRDLGERYTAAVSAVRTMDQSKIKDPQAMMAKQMESADALSGFMNAMTALRQRSPEAGNILTPELQAFRPS